MNHLPFATVKRIVAEACPRHSFKPESIERIGSLVESYITQLAAESAMVSAERGAARTGGLRRIRAQDVDVAFGRLDFVPFAEVRAAELRAEAFARKLKELGIDPREVK